MKRILSFFFIMISVAACKPEDAGIHGYVEGEYVYLSPTVGGILKTLDTERGQKAEAGKSLFTLDTVAIESEITAAKAEVARASAAWNNLTKGKRPEEIDVILKQKAQAEASYANAKTEYERAKSLRSSNTVSQAYLDERKAAYDTSSARVGELSAQLKTASLGAREDEITAAKSAVDIAEQKIIGLDKKLSETSPKTPAAGKVENTFFRPGEFVPAGKAVVSILPPENIKIRFFVPQADLPKFTQGKKITVSCDGCTKQYNATVSYISSSAEFTPPVIYSVGSRNKLVFMVEAKPDVYAEELRPGLPINIGGM